VNSLNKILPLVLLISIPPDVVGGHGGPIDKTALMVTGAQLSASWMIPVLISAIGIGVFVVTRKS